MISLQASTGSPTFPGSGWSKCYKGRQHTNESSFPLSYSIVGWATSRRNMLLIIGVQAKFNAFVYLE
jgi:hypothetical protein